MVIVMAEKAGHLFYSRLFEVAPELRPMFKEDTSLQEKKLIDMITYVVANLDKMEGIMADVKELGLRHKEYGAKPHHYAIIGDCLLWTLKKGLAESWNEELETAWNLAYTTLSNAMMEARIGQS